MRQPFTKAIVLVCFLSIIFVATPSPTTHAGFFDRIKDIYNTPEKISELESQYLDAKAELVEQQQKLKESILAAEEAARKQDELMKQNEQLMQENANLQAQVEQAKNDKQSFINKLINTVIIIAILFVSYIVSIRVWRYLVWRKQSRSGRRGISG